MTVEMIRGISSLSLTANTSIDKSDFKLPKANSTISGVSSND